MPLRTSTTWSVRLLSVTFGAYIMQEDLARVDWTLYTIKSPLIFNPTESLIPQGRLQSLPYVDIDETLEEAVNVLRAKDFYSLLDVTNSAVWVFQIPGHTSDDHSQRRQSELGQLISGYGLISEPCISNHQVKG